MEAIQWKLPLLVDAMLFRISYSFFPYLKLVKLVPSLEVILHSY